jgi:hypothetical protein
MRAGDHLYFEAIQVSPDRNPVKPAITGCAHIDGCRGEIDTLDNRARGSSMISTISSTGPFGSI